MTNINTNEISSLETTLETPKKELPENNIKNRKNIFMVNYENAKQKIRLNKKKEKHKRRKRSHFTKIKKKSDSYRSIKKIKNNELHLLDFDLILKDIIEPKKEKLLPLEKVKNNSIKKLLSKKRKLQSKTKKNILNKSKYIFISIILAKKAKKIINHYLPPSDNKFNKDNNISLNNYDIFNLNNFCSNTVKIKEKSINHIIACPTFDELSEDFFEDNNIEVRNHIKLFH